MKGGEEKITVFRVEKNKNYTVMSNVHLRDQNLSLKAKGLLSLILSLPEDWHYSIRGLAKICREGKAGITSGLKELENAGYLTRHQLRGERGQMGQTEYVIYEKPRSPCSDIRDAEITAEEMRKERESYRDLIKENIEYDILISGNPYHEDIDEIRRDHAGCCLFQKTVPSDRRG